MTQQTTTRTPTRKRHPFDVAVEKALGMTLAELRKGKRHPFDVAYEKALGMKGFKA